MRKHFKVVPLYVRVGNIDSAPAEKAVAEGHAHSLRGRALLLFDQAHLAQILAKTDLDPKTIALVLRASARVEAERLAKNAGEVSQSAASDPEVA